MDGRSNRAPTRSSVAEDCDKISVAEAMATARSIAQKMVLQVANMDVDELTSIAYSAAVEAIRGHDPRLGTFEARLVFLVVRRIRDHMRELDPLTRKQRREAKNLAKIDAALLEPNKLRFDVHPDAWVHPEVVLGRRARRDEDARAPRIDHLSKILAEELCFILSPRETKVVELYFWGGHLMREIGVLLGVHESMISQVMTKAMHKIRKYAAEGGLQNNGRGLHIGRFIKRDNSSRFPHGVAT